MGRLVCIGDSITDCGRIFENPPLGNGYVRFLQEKLADQSPGWNVVNCGVNGFTVARLVENIDRAYLPLAPDIVTILIGINDIGMMMDNGGSQCDFEAMYRRFFENYEILLNRLQAPGRRLLLMEPFVFPWPREFQTWIPHVKAMSKGIRTLAGKHDIPYVPLHDELNEKAREYGMDRITLDGIHLTAEGQKILAEKLYIRLRQYTE